MIKFAATSLLPTNSFHTSTMTPNSFKPSNNNSQRSQPSNPTPRSGPSDSPQRSHTQTAAPHSTSSERRGVGNSSINVELLIRDLRGLLHITDTPFDEEQERLETPSSLNPTAAHPPPYSPPHRQHRQQRSNPLYHVSLSHQGQARPERIPLHRQRHILRQTLAIAVISALAVTIGNLIIRRANAQPSSPELSTLPMPKFYDVNGNEMVDEFEASRENVEWERELEQDYESYDWL